MADVTFILGKEYGRTDGDLPLSVDLTPATDGEIVKHSLYAKWDGPIGDGNYAALTHVPGEWITHFQGSDQINGLSLHIFDHGPNRQTVSLIGVPLENWVGHRIVVTSRVKRGDAPEVRVVETFNLTFVTDTAYAVNHSPSSLGAGSWIPSKTQYDRLLTRVTALETEVALLKGAAAAST